MSKFEAVKKVLDRTNWDLFLKQKAWLAEQIAELEPSGYSATECPEGILNFMDAVQDAWWPDGVPTGIQPWMIHEGIRRHVVEFIADPHADHGTVCKIGEYWFYFGGTTAEEEDPEEFLANADLDEVAEDICQVLKDFRTEMPDEYQYYIGYLSEHLSDA